MKNTYILFIFIISLSILGCSSGSDDGNDTPVNTPPTASSYIKPNNNQTCTGTETAQNSINVFFEWEPFQDQQDSSLDYTLTVKNLSANTTVATQNTSNNSVTLTLEKGISYSWFVTATDSENESVTGTTWQFQTPFDAVSNYAPFPATLTSPINGATLSNTSVSLTWEGNDPDNGETTQLTYNVHLSTSNPPTVVSTAQTTTSYDTTLASGIYYWMIVSKDPSGNTSNSQVRQFTIQ